MKLCEVSGCYATAAGMLVFEGQILDRGPAGNAITYPTWPWQWRCEDHSKGEGRNIPDSLWGRVKEALERRTGKHLGGLNCGLSNLTEAQVDKLRQDSEKGETERLVKPPPVSFVTVKELRRILMDPNLRA